MTTALGELDYLREVRQRLETAAHGTRGTIVAEAADFLCCSKQKVYTRLQEVGYSSGRKTRADRGRTAITEDVALKTAALVKQATRANGKRTMPLTVACDIMRNNGMDTASTATMSRAMRRYGCHPDQVAQGAPSVRMRSLHPNHTWQVDPSLCVLFYLRTGGVAVMDESKFYKNKPGNVAKIAKERVWRYVITDHYSGTIYVRYVLSAGETAQALVDVFLDAISQRGQDDPMHGVPVILLMDCGSANTSHLFLNLLDRLGVRHITHLPGNPRAKGSVECANNIVETQFEGRLTYLKVQSLEELQEAADRWRRYYNAYSVHTRTKNSRNDIWLRIAEAQLRLAPPLELCRELVTTKPKMLKIRPDMSIRHSVKGFGSNDYDVRHLPGLVPQMKLEVVVNPYRAPAIDVTLVSPEGDESIWTVEPKAVDDAGFWENAPVIGQEYKALPETKADKRAKEINEITGGEDRKNVHAPEGIDVMADVKEAPTYISKRGRDLGLSAARRELKPLTVTEAAMILKKRMGEEWNREAYEWLNQRYADGVPADQVDAIFERLLDSTAAPAPLKVVGGSK